MVKLCIIFLLFWLSSCQTSTCKDAENFAKPIHYDIFVTERSNNGRRFEIIGKDTLNKRAKYSGVDGMYINIIDSLSIGDRIKKDTGSLKITIYKNNRKIYFFYYGCKEDSKIFNFRDPEVEYYKK